MISSCSYNKVVLIGSGNVATVLGKSLFRCGISVLQVISKNIDNARALAGKLNASFSNSIAEIDKTADIYIITVPDNAIELVAEQIHLPEKLILHTAGSVSIKLLNNCSNFFGVIWPLQSLRKEIDSIPTFPLIIEGNNKETEQIIYDFALKISSQVVISNELERTKLHLAAVLVSNFANHLYAQAQAFCHNENIEFHLLHPLIMETAQRILSNKPSQTQTGPAIRRDFKTIQHHLDLLDNNPSLKHIYQVLTDSILLFNQK